METQDAVQAKVRTPQQGRSKASFERMLTTAEQLMAERGSDDFTLNEVAKLGKVSIGSIYCRFDSKDDMVHAVQVRVLQRVDADMLLAIARVREQRLPFARFIALFVDRIAESLRQFSAQMRPFMLRASSDPVVASLGKGSYGRTATAVRDALLDHRASIRHADPDRAVDVAFRVLYASLARYLGFGSSSEAAGEGDWTQLKLDLADMTLAYLRFTGDQAGDS